MAALSQLLDLSGQVALITGASRGIGRAIAELFGQAGARLGLLARSAGPLEEVAADLNARLKPEQALALVADVAQEDQVNAAVVQLVARWGRVDILVNNAGLISLGGPVWKVTPEEWARIMGANLTGTYLCSRAVVPHLQAQKSGRIINIASISAQTGGVSGGAHYSSSKGGMISLTKTLARDLAPFGVTVNAIAPGQIDADPNLLTPEQREKVTALIPLGRLGLPEDVAHAALFLASPMASYITGATLDVNGGILKR
jgi:3-oxoacyl-[acyl-carrier protein] reductase